MKISVEEMRSRTIETEIGVLRLLRYMRTGLGRKNWRGGFRKRYLGKNINFGIAKPISTPYRFYLFSLYHLTFGRFCPKVCHFILNRIILDYLILRYMRTGLEKQNWRGWFSY